MKSSEDLICAALGKTAEPFSYKCGGTRRKGWVKRVLRPDQGLHGEPYQIVEEHWRALAEADIRLFVGAAVVEIAPGKFSNGYEDTPRNRRHPPASYDQIFALPKLPVLDIIEFAEVGSHNAMPSDDMLQMMGIDFPIEPPEFVKGMPDYAEKVRAVMSKQPHGDTPWTFVRDAMEEVMSICPIEIQSADKAGLHATLLKRVTEKQAERISRVILTVNPEAADVAVEELMRRKIKTPKMKQARGIPDYEVAMQKCISELGILVMWWD